jgi:hypothetical protein
LLGVSGKFARMFDEVVFAIDDRSPGKAFVGIFEEASR